ncbi:hypothetical protein HYR99_27590, partial [Candidatus Poribacteria bacterium]|nr:hypothetical protein [Candidatus Poribacteria bacterium]
MTCEGVKLELFSLMTGQLNEQEVQQMRAHLSMCSDCRAEYHALEQVWNGLDAVEMVEVPEELRERTLNRIHAESERAKAVVPSSGLSLGRAVGAGAAGALLTLFYLGLLTQRISFMGLSMWEALTVAVVWSGISISVCAGYVGRYQWRGVDLHFTAGVGLIAAGIVWIGAVVCPDLTLLALFQQSRWSEIIVQRLGIVGGYFAFGLLGALVPTLLVSIGFGVKCHQHRLKNGLAGAGVFVLLISPSIYFQCATAAYGLSALTLSWMAGMLIG